MKVITSLLSTDWSHDATRFISFAIFTTFSWLFWDPGPIIVYPCQPLTDSVTFWLTNLFKLEWFDPSDKDAKSYVDPNRKSCKMKNTQNMQIYNKCKCAKSSLPWQTYKTKPTKLNLPKQISEKINLKPNRLQVK